MSNIHINIEQLFEIPGAEIYEPDNFEQATGVSTDTRKIKSGEIYFALKGENFDGHDFVKNAVEKGASAVVINEDQLEKFDDTDTVIVTVPDTVKAYGDLAAIYRMSLPTKIIGITGSNGKTTTKEILASLLSLKYKVVKTEANDNNHIGVPKTILSCGNDVDFLVIELGTNHFGEIPYTAVIAKPDFAIITNIGESHIEYLKDRNGVLEEKSALFTETLNGGGRIFVNTDDDLLNSKYGKNPNAVTFGSKSGRMIYEIAGHRADGRPKVKITYGDRTIISGVPLWSDSNVKNLAAAVVVAFECGLTDMDIEKGIASLKPYKGRLNVIEKEDFIVIDDTYNANPASMESALKVLGDINKYENKVVFLGDMFELGEFAVKHHKYLAALILQANVQEVYLAGNLMQHTFEEFSGKDRFVKHFHTSDEMADFATDYNKSNKTILVKGSRGMKMETIVKKLSGEG